MPKPIRLFYSYSHADEDLRDILEKHLTILRRNELIENWHDRKINPGNDWNDDINQNLLAADIILFLVSVDFISSEYCNSIEVKKAIEMHQNGDAKCIPIFLRQCAFESAPFGKFQGLPRDARFVTSKDFWNDLDKPFTEIAKELEDEVKRIASEKEATVKTDKNTNLSGRKSNQSSSLFNSLYSLLPKPTNLFTGRENELKGFKEKFSTGNIFCIAGLGGTGKSEFAARLIEEMNLQNVVWFDCKKDSLFDSLIEFTGYHELLNIENKDKIAIFLGYRELIERDEKIIFLDNYQDIINDEFEAFFRFLKNNLVKAKFILIAREKIEFDDIDVIPFYLEGLNNNSVEYAKKIIKEKYQNSILITDERLKKICDDLQGHPFAIQLVIQILSYEGNDFDIFKIINEYSTERERLSNRLLDEIFNHPKSTSEEKELLQTISVFRGPLKKTAIEEIYSKNYKEPLKNLINKLMISQKEGVYFLHPLVREFSYLKLECKSEIHNKALDYYLKKNVVPDLAIQEEIFYHFQETKNYTLFVKFIEENAEFYLNYGYHNLLKLNIEFLFSKNYKTQKLFIILSDIFVCINEASKALDTIKEAYLLPTVSEEILLEVKITELELLISYAKIDDTVGEVTKLLNQCEAIHFSKGKAVCLSEIGTYYTNHRDFDKGESRLLEAYRICKEVGYYAGLHFALIMLAYNYYLRRKFSKAHEYYLESLNKAEEFNHLSNRSKAKNGFALIHNAKNEFDDALKIFNEKLMFDIDIGDKYGQSRSLYNIADTLLKKVNASKEERDISYLDYLNRSLVISKELVDYDGMARSFGMFGVHYAQEQNYFESIKSFLIAISFFTKGKKSANTLCFESLHAIRMDIGNPEYQRILNLAYADIGEDIKEYISLTDVQFKPVVSEKEPGRNDLCPCGSGKKYKHCHGKSN